MPSNFPGSTDSFFDVFPGSNVLRSTAALATDIGNGVESVESVLGAILSTIQYVTSPPYSADNTGATDATAAFTAAGLSEAAIYVPPGTYLITGTIVGPFIVPPGVTINGGSLTSNEFGKGAALVSFLQSGTGAVARTTLKKMRDVVSVRDFGAVGDGVANDTAPIQAGVAELQSRGGGVLLFPPGTYRVTAPIIVSKSGVVLRGSGASYYSHATSRVPPSAIKYDGTALAGAVVTITSVSGVAGLKVTDCGLNNISVDANGLADVAVAIKSVNQCRFNFSATGATDAQVTVGTVAELADARDVQECFFELVRVRATGTADGIRMQTATLGANISIGRFGYLYATHEDGDGIFIGNVDNCVFEHVMALRPSGAGRGVVLGAGDGINFANCRGNVIEHCSPGAGGVVAEGTETAADASDNNLLLYLDRENGAADPTIGTGAGLAWGTNFNVIGGMAYIKAAIGDSHTSAVSVRAAMGAETVRVRSSAGRNLVIDNAGGLSAYDIAVNAANGNMEINRSAGSGRLIVSPGVQLSGNVGFYGTVPASKQNVTGSRGGNAALASLLTALAAIGLITDSTAP